MQNEVIYTQRRCCDHLQKPGLVKKRNCTYVNLCNCTASKNTLTHSDCSVSTWYSKSWSRSNKTKTRFEFQMIDTHNQKTILIEFHIETNYWRNWTRCFCIVSAQHKKNKQITSPFHKENQSCRYLIIIQIYYLPQSVNTPY